MEKKEVEEAMCSERRLEAIGRVCRGAEGEVMGAVRALRLY